MWSYTKAFLIYVHSCDSDSYFAQLPKELLVLIFSFWKRDFSIPHCFSHSISIINESGGLGDTRGVLIDEKNSRLYVAHLKGISVYDLSFPFWPLTPWRTQCDYPTGMLLDEKTDNIYISDYSQNAFIRLFDKKGKELQKIHSPTTHQSRIWSMARSPTTRNIFVTNITEHQVHVYNESNDFLFSFGSSGDEKGQFRDPRGIAISPISGNVFVASHDKGDIQVFDQSGKFLSVFCSGLTTVDGLCFEKEHLFVSGWDKQGVKVFSDQGEIVTTIPVMTKGILGITWHEKTEQLFICNYYNKSVEVWKYYVMPKTNLELSTEKANRKIK